MDIDTKEVAVVKSQVTKAQAAADKIIVTTDEEMIEAGELRKKIKTVGKMIKEKKDPMVKSANETLRMIRDFFRPLEEGNQKAEDTVTDKMLAYQRKQEEKQRKAEAEAAAKLAQAEKDLEAGKITEKQAEKVMERTEAKLEKAPEPIKKSDSFHTRMNKKFRIVDESKIPLAFMVPNEVAIRKAMLAGTPVEGVEYYEEATLV